MKKVRYLLGFLLVRPRRYVFHKMVCATVPRWLPEKHDYMGWLYPNIHWWVLDQTVFRFFKWLYWDGWRPFCDWTGGSRQTYPLIARALHKIGQTTAGFAICGGECYHCGSSGGDPVTLSGDETGEVFRLEGTGSYPTPDGTDHRFWGTTICPSCGYEQRYEDGSL